MTDNIIHLLYRQDLISGGMQLMAPYAKFEKAQDYLKEVREYWTKEKRQVSYDDGVSVIVVDCDGQPRWHYFISTRTVIE